MLHTSRTDPICWAAKHFLSYNVARTCSKSGELSRDEHGPSTMQIFGPQGFAYFFTMTVHATIYYWYYGLYRYKQSTDFH